jgi:hypothetical protein
MVIVATLVIFRKAWTERHGLTKEEAKKQYIQNVQNFMPNIKLTDEEPENASDSDDDLFLKEDETKVNFIVHLTKKIEEKYFWRWVQQIRYGTRRRDQIWRQRGV